MGDHIESQLVDHIESQTILRADPVPDGTLPDGSLPYVVLRVLSRSHSPSDKVG